MRTLFRQRKLSTSQIIILSFLIVILTGALLLTLPIASKEGTSTSFADALFTATSATCVTGLVVKDTATYWSGFGQLIILILIQIGGMGAVTVAITIAIFSGRKIGLMQRQTMQEAIAAPQVGGILKLTRFILGSMMAIEMTGALVLYFVFHKDYGWIKGIWYSIFHSISAFCNAGFDLMGHREQFSSLTWYSGNPIINFVIMLLIIIGGIGFLTWDDMRKHHWHVRQYRMQSKVILVTTVVLIFIPAIYFFGLEYRDLPLLDRIYASLFQSVTTRTAGFNTMDLTQLHENGKVLMILLMLIGGAPGSTAGGMKITTFAVLILCAISIFKRQDTVHCFSRRIADTSIRNAASILLIYLSLFLMSGCIICYIEELPLLTACFETASAIGTVGLTLGVTTKLHILSRLILIGLMFFGRVGGLTLIYAAVSDNSLKGIHYPQERITVG